MTENKSMNPFAGKERQELVMSSEEQRAVQEVQASMAIAKRFPRDQADATDRIIKACTRATLAAGAIYAYPRGGTQITGPSIRLAEAIAQNWGNISFGIRELTQAKGESLVEAFAWDMETNTRQVKVFRVPHKRRARGQNVALDDPRDIYEMVANQGARRLRSCILGIVPGDVVDAAVRQCEVTQEHSMGAASEEIKKLVSAFEPLGVSASMLTKRLGHNLEATIAAEIISLRKVYASLRDGMSAVADWFEVAGAGSKAEPADHLAELKESVHKSQEQPKPATDTEAQETRLDEQREDLARKIAEASADGPEGDGASPPDAMHEVYPEESFTKNVNGWAEAIANSGKSVPDFVNFLASKGVDLSASQELRLIARVEEIKS